MTKNLTRLNSLDGNNNHTNGNGNGNGKKAMPSASSAIASQTQKSEEIPQVTVSQALVEVLENLGVKEAFGVSGGAMATVWGALSNSPSIDVLHCRHEGGAAFAAAEAHFASDRPMVVFTTAGPGITNALTGLLAARDEGAKVIHLSACTSAPQRGRWAIQETSDQTIPQGGIFTSGALFNYATVLESPQQLPQIARRLALGLAQPGGFVAHISIPTLVQSTPIETSIPEVDLTPALPVPSTETVEMAAQLLSQGSFAIWAGFGARGASAAIRELAERTGAAVMCSPRGKGIFPENHPQYVGVTGVGGHESVMNYMQERSPQRILVLGTRLGEPTSFWSKDMIPPQGFIHVDVNPQVPGVAFPFAKTLPIISDADTFVQALLKHFPQSQQNISLPNPEVEAIAPAKSNLVRPEILMQAVQRIVIEGSDAVVLSESGNSFTWTTNMLRFPQANRYRVSTGVGSMGHNVTGVVGAAKGRNGKAVAIVGDGSMLMNSEVSTAVKYQLPTVWIVLNDAYYNMCNQGMTLLGMKGADAKLPDTDFSLIARGMGAVGIRVEAEAGLESALEEAMAATGPVVLDVTIDPDRFAPSKGRNKSLSAQGVKSSKQVEKGKQVSFPLV